MQARKNLILLNYSGDAEDLDLNLADGTRTRKGATVRSLHRLLFRISTGYKDMSIM